MSRSIYTFTLIMSSLLFFIVIVPQAQDEQSVADIITQAMEADEAEFTILFDLLETIDLMERLEDTNLLWMVFAPTDTAFETYFETVGTDLEALQQNPQRVATLLGYHLTDDPLLPDAFVEGLEINTFINQRIVVSIVDETVNLNDDATLPDAPIIAGNGLIYVIDAVLIRPRNAIDSQPLFVATETTQPSDTDDDEATTTPTPDADPTTTSTPTPRPSSTVDPSDNDILLPNNGDGECIVYIEFEEQADVRVGPGNNRTGITFLDLDVEYDVISYSVDDRGVIWYELVKEDAALGRLIEEAWVSSEEVLTDGDCTELELGDAPPVIPIGGTSAP